MATKVQKKVKIPKAFTCLFLLTYIFLLFLNFFCTFTDKLYYVFPVGLQRCERLVCRAKRYIHACKRYIRVLKRYV